MNNGHASQNVDAQGFSPNLPMPEINPDNPDRDPRNIGGNTIRTLENLPPEDQYPETYGEIINLEKPPSSENLQEMDSASDTTSTDNVIDLTVLQEKGGGLPKEALHEIEKGIGKFEQDKIHPGTVINMINTSRKAYLKNSFNREMEDEIGDKAA